MRLNHTTPQTVQLGILFTSDGDATTANLLTSDDIYISVDGSSWSLLDAPASTPDLDGWALAIITTVDLGAAPGYAQLYIPSTPGRLAWQSPVIEFPRTSGLIPSVDVTHLSGDSGSADNLMTFFQNMASGAGVPFSEYWSNLTSDSALTLSTLLYDFLTGTALSSLPIVNVDQIGGTSPGSAWLTSDDLQTILGGQLDTTNSDWATSLDIDAILDGQLDTTVSDWATTPDIDSILAAIPGMDTSDVAQLFDDRAFTTNLARS